MRTRLRTIVLECLIGRSTPQTPLVRASPHRERESERTAPPSESRERSKATARERSAKLRGLRALTNRIRSLAARWLSSPSGTPKKTFPFSCPLRLVGLSVSSSSFVRVSSRRVLVRDRVCRFARFHTCTHACARAFFLPHFAGEQYPDTVIGTRVRIATSSAALWSRIFWIYQCNRRTNKTTATHGQTNTKTNETARSE